MVTRIRELLEHKNLTPTQFADLVGVCRPVMSHILSERNKPSLEVVQRIISAFPELSLSWLLSGTGEMLAVEATAPPEASEEASPLNAVPAPAIALVASAISPIVSDPVASLAASEVASAPVLPQNPVVEPSLKAASALAASGVGVALPKALTAPQVNEVPAPARPAPRRFQASQAGPPVPAAGTAAVPAASQAGPPPAIAAPAPVASPANALPSVPDAAMLPFLTEPGKAIRRIVIFYRDGSFADYQPEQ